MSKAEWLRTCRRTENRLQNLKVENKDVTRGLRFPFVATPCPNDASSCYARSPVRPIFRGHDARSRCNEARVAEDRSRAPAPAAVG